MVSGHRRSIEAEERMRTVRLLGGVMLLLAATAVAVMWAVERGSRTSSQRPRETAVRQAAVYFPGLTCTLRAALLNTRRVQLDARLWHGTRPIAHWQGDIARLE